MVLGWRRWRLASGTLFLVRACDLLLRGLSRDAQKFSIVGTLGAFGGNDWSPFRLWHPAVGPIGHKVEAIAMEELPFVKPPPSIAQLAYAAKLIATSGEATFDAVQLTAAQAGPADAAGGSSASAAVQTPAVAALTLDSVLRDFRAAGPTLEGVGVYLLSPNPLDVLLRRILGMPDGLEL
jgi:hypothetical protein